MVDFKVIDLGIESQNLPRVLVVDDDIALQSVVFDTLGDFYRLIPAHNGREAFEKAKHVKPQLILMDVMMPDIGGYEAVRMLHSEKTTAHIPIVMFSAVDFDTSTVQMLKQEPNVKGFLVKPFRPNQLREIVKSHILKE
ncbi:hypothetical protein BVX98_07170 [bacterium F11]|nr:hypothetical protein BVX98_07170 [bacterium F11]